MWIIQMGKLLHDTLNENYTSRYTIVSIGLLRNTIITHFTKKCFMFTFVLDNTLVYVNVL